MNTKRVHPLAWIVLLLGPALLRLAPIHHGQPDNFLPDTHVVRNALGMAKEKSLVPPSGRYSTYPYLLPYLLLPVYAGEYALGRWQGEWQGPGEFGNRMLEEPWRAHLSARIVLALLASLAPWLVFLGLRRAGLGTGAWIGAALLATCLLHVHYSTQERPWAPLITFLMGCGFSCAAFVESGRYRHLLFSGAWAGLAVACHQAGLAAVLMPALAWLWAPKRWRGEELWQRLRYGVACAATFLIVAIVLGHPYLLVHGIPKGDAVVMNEALQGTNHITLGGQSAVFAFRWATLERLSRVFLGYDPALLVLGVAGLLLAWRRRPARPAVVFGLLWGGYWLTNVNDHVRYLLPLAGGLAWSAGFAGEWMWRRRAGRYAVVGLLLLALVQVVRFDLILRRTDTRALARAEILDRAIPGTLAVDVGGPEMPLDAASLQRLSRYRDLYGREAHRLARLEAGQPLPTRVAALPLDAVVALDRRHHGSQLAPKAAELFGADLEALLRAEGVTTVLVIDREGGDPRSEWMSDPLPPEAPTASEVQAGANPTTPKLAPLVLGPEALFTVSPRADGATPSSARLPLAMEFPLIDLWSVDRPGPVVRLYPWSAR